MTAVATGRSAFAQDTNYWTEQFGGTEMLLGGAVVASVADSSAAYYNPGALALSSDRQALLSANVADYMTVKGEQALGRGQDFGDSRLRWLPAFFSGELRIAALGRSRLAYCALVRQSAPSRLEDRRELTPPVGDAPATLYGDSRLDAALAEYWGGLSWAWPLGEKVGVGATLFAAARDQRGRKEASVQAWQASGAGTIGVESRDYSFVHGRAFLRLGLNAQLRSWRLGLTLTTPSLGIWGKGSAGYDSSLVATSPSAQPGIARIATNSQSELPAHFRSPLSVAVGLSRSLGRVKLSASAEWFDRVSPFSALEPQPFSGQSSGTPIHYDVSYGLRSVLDYGAGLQYDLSPTWRAFAGFRSDRSGALPRAQSTSTYWTTDLYHLSAGFTVKLRSADLALGFVYARGDGDTPPIVEQMPGLDGETMLPIRTQWRRYTLLLGLNLPFATNGP